MCGMTIPAFARNTHNPIRNNAELQSCLADIKGGSFPIRLKPEEWTSGEHVWLLDVVAPSQKMASSVLANFKQVVKQGGDVRIHPMVARQVDPELLNKMGAAVDGGAA
jgi:hypothetical protein